MRTVIGIDPGQSGAICILRADLEYHYIEMSEYDCYTYDPVDVYIETQTYSPRQKGAGKTMKEYGRLLGFFTAVTGKTPIEVSPSKWYKFYGTPTGLDYKERKEWTANNLRFHFNKQDWYGPKGGLLDGRSDALAIAYYGLTSLS